LCLCAVILKLLYRSANLVTWRDFVWEILMLVSLYDSYVLGKQSERTLVLLSLIAFLLMPFTREQMLLSLQGNAKIPTEIQRCVIATPYLCR